MRQGVEGEVYNVGGHNEKTNLEIVKLTIATIHRLMTEHPEYRKVLKKQEKNANGEITIDWMNEWYLNNQEWVEEVTSGDYQKYYERMYK